MPEDPFLETYLVRPGGATVFGLMPDERVTVIDREGGQVAELTVLAADGRDDANALGAVADGPATVVRTRCASATAACSGASSPRGARPDRGEGGTSLRRIVSARHVAGVPYGSRRHRRRRCAGWPHRRRRASPSELLVEVRRTAARTYDQLELPPPLAEPRLDVRVDAATALAYEVRAGEFIQVIDVEGKQCSDFLAFHRRKLESGLERGLDATTTRSLMGQAYPQPGLQGKFYDTDQDPLIEVVRDTVGRHDTFGLACTAKYYEDKGYPGHVNCSDNFNGQVTPYGIAPRMGWEALNFFYNTGFDSNMVFVMDEPWSRPGDYVLLRAMSDLVCASSACPDDIDPANGWQITPIQVRVYAPDNTFSVAIARRVTADAEPVLTRETTFHPRTSDRTKSFVEYRGYWLPHCFDNEGAIAEYWACREKVAVMDCPAPQVGGAGTRRGVADPARDHPRRAAALGRPGHLHGGLQRDGRDDRRRDRLPARAGQLPLRRGDEYDGIWLKARRPARAQGLGQAVDRPAPQRRRPGAREPRAAEKIVWTPPTNIPRRPQVVPLHGRPHLHLRRDPGRRLAHGLHGGARLRGLVPPLGRACGVGRDLGGRTGSRPDAAGPRGARHPSHRVGADLRRVRVRR